MSKWNKVRDDVLIKCKRHCCYCEEYKGINIVVHHIKQKADGGEDSMDNAIPLCFDCHSNIGMYNPHHPNGNSFKPTELKRIRDEFYIKAKDLSRKLSSSSDFDYTLLAEFKNDYTPIIEYCVRTDFTSELVDINLNDNIYYLYYDKWSKKKYIFDNPNIEVCKNKILGELDDLRHYLTEDFLRYHASSGMLIYKNQSWEEGCILRDVFQPNALRLRQSLQDQLNVLYTFT